LLAGSRLCPFKKPAHRHQTPPTPTGSLGECRFRGGSLNVARSAASAMTQFGPVASPRIEILGNSLAWIPIQDHASGHWCRVPGHNGTSSGLRAEEAVRRSAIWNRRAGVFAGGDSLTMPIRYGCLPDLVLAHSQNPSPGIRHRRLRRNACRNPDLVVTVSAITLRGVPPEPLPQLMLIEGEYRMWERIPHPTYSEITHKAIRR
jgi:hypothetical protein